MILSIIAYLSGLGGEAGDGFDGGSGLGGPSFRVFKPPLGDPGEGVALGVGVCVGVREIFTTLLPWCGIQSPSMLSSIFFSE